MKIILTKMSVQADAINKIKTAETEAAAIRQAAIDAGRAVIAEAEKKAAVLLKNAESDADSNSKRILSEAEKRAAGYIADAVKKADDKAKKMTAQAETRLNDAAAVIIERILK
jgi:V/A-type H+-transporting ATPase subunit G/H